jgi:hypothetical protein
LSCFFASGNILAASSSSGKKRIRHTKPKTTFHIVERKTHPPKSRPSARSFVLSGPGRGFTSPPVSGSGWRSSSEAGEAAACSTARPNSKPWAGPVRR